MKNIILYLTLSWIILGCKSENQHDITPQTSLISVIKAKGKTETKFIYDKENRVIEIQKYFDDGESIWESYRYTWNENRVERSENWSSHPLYLGTCKK